MTIIAFNIKDHLSRNRVFKISRYCYAANMFLFGREFLSSVHGLGLKSVECIRLLSLHHLAFPVSAVGLSPATASCF